VKKEIKLGIPAPKNTVVTKTINKIALLITVKSFSQPSGASFEQVVL
jgi:hypothetical protein